MATDSTHQYATQNASTTGRGTMDSADTLDNALAGTTSAPAAPPPDSSGISEAIRHGLHGRILVSPAQMELILAKVNQMLTYKPRVGILGKTGAGKSSLCNALFGRDVCPIGHVEACTRQPKEVLLKLGRKGIALVDLPGVGEDANRDQEYRRLYAELLPELDLVVWLLKGDERAYAPDVEFYTQVIRPHLDQGKPFVIAISQVDKIAPDEQWNAGGRCPGGEQADNVEAKRRAVAKLFRQPLERVVAISTRHRYGLGTLVETMVRELPDEKKITILPATKPEHVTQAARASAEKGFLARVDAIVKAVTGVIVNAAKIASIVGAVWAWFKSRRQG